jgi:F-type H+-transporting ATPase subunit a
MKKWMYKRNLLVAVLLLVTAFSTFGAEHPKEGPVDVKGIIFEHLGDAYTWHIATIGHVHIQVPLLVIVRGQDGAIQAFSSSRLHGEHPYKGFYLGEEGSKYAGKIVYKNTAGAEVRPLDFSITKNVLALFVSAVIVLLVVLLTARWYKKHPLEAPGGFVGVVEVVVDFLREDVIKPNIGADYKRYQPYLMTVFFFILANNLLGLIPLFPGGANVTGNIAITFILALFTMVIVNIFGTKEYWKEVFWPEVPMFLKLPIPLMPVVEMFGVISKPFSLMIRLFANVMAGHTIMLSLVCLIFFTVSMGTAINATMTSISVLLSVFMFFVEILVSFLQAYIFTLLSSVYIGLARVKHHPHPKHQ